MFDFVRLHKGFDAKAIEAWGQEALEAAGVKLGELAFWLRRKGFSEKNPATAKDVQSVVDYVLERTKLEDEKVDETFLEVATTRPHADVVDYSFIMLVKEESSEEMTPRVVCQWPTHNGGNRPVLPTQRYMVNMALAVKCHEGTDRPIPQGEFAVTDKGRIVRSCPYCRRNALDSLRGKDMKLSFYRAGEAVNKAAKIIEAAKVKAKAKAEADRLTLSAASRMGLEKSHAGRSGHNARRAQSLRRGSFKSADLD